MRFFRLIALLAIAVLFLSASTGCHSLRQGNPFFPHNTAVPSSGCSGGGGGLFGAPS